jgi:hypothetical protein
MKLAIASEITKRVELKNIKNGLGNNSQSFFADVWVDGNKIGYTENDAKGGQSKHSFDTKVLESILLENGWKERTHKAYNYNPYQSTSEWKFETPYESTFEWKFEDISTLDMIDYLFEIMELQKKLFPKIKNGIVWGNLNTNKYKILEISKLSNNDTFNIELNKIQSNLLDNEFIINNNL